MDYIYDIVLNFHENYYEFYEWKSSDKIINIKRIPIYRVNTEDYLNIKNNDVSIEISSLPKPNKMFLITNGAEIIGIIINKNGKVIKKSSLILEESDDILQDKDLIKKVKLKYKINKINKNYHISRISQEKKIYIDKYLKNIDKFKDEYLLKYIYYEIYNKEENNLDKIYNNLYELYKENKNKLYDALKRVNLELKK